MYSFLNKKIISTLLLTLVVIFSIFGVALKSEAAAPTVVSKGTVRNVTTGDLTLTLPRSIAANERIVVAAVIWAPNTASDVVNISTPSGYTQIFQTGTPASGTIDGRIGYFWKRAAGGETSVTITRPTGADTGNDTAFGGQSYRITGAETTGNPWDDAQAYGPTLSSDRTGTYTAVTVSGAERTLLAIQAVQDNVASAVTPT